MTVPYTFANISGQIPLSELDANFAAVSAYSNTAGTVTASAQPNIASVGTLTTLTVAGNVTADYFLGNTIGSISNAVYANTAGFATTAGLANIANVAYSVTGANVSGTVANATYALTANSASYANTATIAVTANVANSVAGANVSGTVANATYALTANVATYVGTVTTNAQPNITSVGNLSSLTVTGNSTVINNSTVGANTIVSGYANIGSYISAVGNVTGNNFISLGSVSTNGNITGANLSVGPGNVNAGNVVFALDGSKFNSAKWTFVETVNADLTSGNQAVSTAHNFSYYSTNYNEVLFVSSSGSGFGETLVIPVQAVTANSVWNINQQIGFKWANLSNANVTVVGVGGGPYTTVNFSIYAR